MIKANCRDRFTAADFDFVTRTVARTDNHRASLVELLTDSEVRDTVLDDPQLFKAVLEQDGPLHISTQCYFYILIRHVLNQTGLHDRNLSDYVASVLDGFGHASGWRSPADGRETSVQYLGDMLGALQHASSSQSFLIRAHMGNYALFLTGMLPEMVARRSHRGGPDVRFYEGMGQSAFRLAARHEAARSWALENVYEMLADCFHEVRIALNRLADSILHLDTGHAPHPFAP